MDLSGKQIGNYIAKSELGSGGMGVVYLCEHPLIRRRVAAKVLHEELAASEEIVRRLFAEAKAANEINSEHIIEVLDFGRIDDNGHELVYLLMEFLEGEALGNRLWRTGLTIDESLHIVSQCCAALEASHAAGIVHRDLKPENIFLLERRGDPNFVKILDFGIAKVSGSPSTKTRTGVLLGTPAYMSPEQCRGAGSVDARADVYSLGIVLYELTTGDVPFNGDGYGQILLAQMTERPKPPTQLNKDLPKVVEAIILRSLEKDPAARYQTMGEFAAAIQEAERSLQIHVPIAQIPRKGLHQRETLLRNARRRDGAGGGAIDHALAHAQPTPLDASIESRMQEASLDAPTQLMSAIVDPDLLGSAGTMPAPKAPPPDAAPTMVDRELPAHVLAASLSRAAQRDADADASSSPAPKMSRDGAGNLTTGPQGMVLPAQDSPLTSSPLGSSSPTLSSGQMPTLVRSAVAEPLPEERRPTTEMDEDQIPRASRLGRNILLVTTLVVALGVLVAYLLRGR